jgi:hypothetical protein
MDLFDPHSVLESDAMQAREISKSSTNGLPEAKRSGFSRRSILSFAGAFGAA